MKTRLLILILIVHSTVGVFAQKRFESDTLPTLSGNLVITFFGHGSLLFTYQDRNIYVDPVMQVADFGLQPKADAILVTHEHGDHFDPEAITKLSRKGTEIYLNQNSYDKLKKGTVRHEGDFFGAAGIPVETVAAYNITGLRGNGIPYHPKGEGNGYVMVFGDVRVYVAGDTELTPEMGKLKNIDVAFLPIGLPYTMSPAMAVEAAKKLKIKILYPYHFNNSNPEEVVRALVGSPITVRVRSLK